MNIQKIYVEKYAKNLQTSFYTIDLTSLQCNFIIFLLNNRLRKFTFCINVPLLNLKIVFGFFFFGK